MKYDRNFKHLEYKVRGSRGMFIGKPGELLEIQRGLAEEIEYIKSRNIINDFEIKFADGNNIKENAASRNFLNSKYFQSFDLTESDILLNLGESELIKIDLDLDELSPLEKKDIYQNGKKPDDDLKVVYIFRSHLFKEGPDREHDEDISLYVKVATSGDKLIVKSIHPDEPIHGSKEEIFIKTVLTEEMDLNRKYEYVNS